MLLIALMALAMLIFIFFIHYYQHFQLSCQKKSEYTAYFCGVLHTNEEFYFFPTSFLLYLVFMIILFILIIVVEILNYSDQNTDETIVDLLLGYSLKSYHDNPLSTIHAINATHVTDYILIYAILILFNWVSLFSFYRYYTTKISTKKFAEVSVKKLFKKFRIYAVVFSALFLLQIHLYYWLFPINVILFCSFNFYCTWKFAAMLIKHYKLCTSLSDNMAISNQQVLKSVIFTKNTSLMIVSINALNLTLFVVTYNVNVLYYLPILWSISGFIFSLNFIRNRTFLSQHWLLLKQTKYCKCLCYKTVKAYVDETNVLCEFVTPVPASKQTLVITIDRQPQLPHKIDTKQINEMTPFKPPPFIAGSQSVTDVIATETNQYSTQLKRANSMPIYNHKGDFGHGLAELDEEKHPLAGLAKIEVYGLTPLSRKIRTPVSCSQNPKAMQLLGIPTTPSFQTPSRSATGTAILRYIMTPLSKLSRATPKSSNSKTRKSVEIESDSDSDSDGTGSDDVDDHEVVAPSTKSPNSPLSLPMMTEVNEEKIGDSQFQFYGKNEEGSTSMKSKCFPINMESLNDMFVSLDVLAKYGFCSTKSILAMHEITSYQKSINMAMRDQDSVHVYED